MFRSIVNGIKAYYKAFGLISKLRLWKYFTIPILISIITGLFFIGAVYFFSGTLGAFIAKIWPWEWGSQTFATISTYLGGFLILVLGLVLYKHIVMALSAPFMSPVSEKVETFLTGKTNHNHRNTSFRQQLSRGIRINMRNLFKEIVFMIPLVIISFIPVIGIVATILIFVIQAYYVGFGNMDYTIERHFDYKQSVGFVKKNRGTAIGNGIVYVLMLFIPIVGFIVTLPIAVVAASIETVGILDKDTQIENQPNKIIK